MTGSAQARRRNGQVTACVILGCAVGTFATTIASRASLPARVPPMAVMERGAYHARDARSGEGLWRHEWTLERRSEDGWTVVRVAQEGEGRRAGSAHSAWVSEMRMRLSGTHFWLASRREVRDQRGRLVEVEERVLDSAAGLGRVSLAHPHRGHADLRRFAVKRSAVDVEMLPVTLRLLPSTEGWRLAFDLVSADGDTIGMEARIAGRETVHVPAGTFECYRIDLVPRGPLGALAGLLLPTTSVWHTITPPHYWVKYRGPEGGMGSRTILRELARFDQHEG